MIGDIDRVGFGVGELAAIMLLGAASLAALALAPHVALAALAGAVLVVLAYGIVRRRSLALGEALSSAYAQLYGRLGETLGALRLVKSFAAEERTAAELGEVDRGLTVNRVGYQKLVGIGQALLQVAGAVLLAVLVWVAVELWQVSALVLLPLIALFARTPRCWARRSSTGSSG